eukprot:1034253-Rhodomonas_salina.2
MLMMLSLTVMLLFSIMHILPFNGDADLCGGSPEEGASVRDMRVCVRKRPIFDKEKNEGALSA